MEYFGCDQYIQNNLVGQGYDGAGNMAGIKSGVQARIRSRNKHATYIHCKSHNLNLSIIHSCTEVPIRNLYNIVEHILRFITASPQRFSVYKQLNASKKSIRTFCPTRWHHHSQSIALFIEQYDVILETLEEISTNANTQTRSEALSLHNSLLNFDIIIAGQISATILSHLIPLVDELQLVKCDLVKASFKAQELINFYQARRNSPNMYDSIWIKASEIAERNDIDVKMPRVVKRQVYSNNTPSTSVKEHFRLNVFIPFLDHLINELNSRLCSPLPRLKAQYLMPSKLDQLTDDYWNDIKKNTVI